MIKRLFLSYRRHDAQGYALAIHLFLQRALSETEVFLDVLNGIGIGDDFVDAIRSNVDKCQTLVAIIGDAWLSSKDGSGRIRLHDPRDYVRLEIGSALALGKLVIPVLLNDAEMPRDVDLPSALKPLARRNALRVRHETFLSDMSNLASEIERERIRLAEEPNDGRPTSSSLGDHRAVVPVSVGDTNYSTVEQLRAGESFCDNAAAPEMVVIPSGRFLMGSPPTEIGREQWLIGSEGPQRHVVLPAPFAISRNPVSRAQFAKFAEATGFEGLGANSWNGKRFSFHPQASWRNTGIDQQEDHPVVNISWHDAQNYVAWLSAVTGRRYRLPTESEWEYAARAGTSTAYWFGETFVEHTEGVTGALAVCGRIGTVSPAETSPNPWALQSVHGNTWEWLEDAWVPNYATAPSDGSQPVSHSGINERVVRGGSWFDKPHCLRCASRDGLAAETRSEAIGFRIARTLVL